MNAPLYLARSGNIYDDSAHSANDGGYYWSSTVHSSEYARNLLFHSGYINSENNAGRYLGLSLRCVLRESRDIVYVSYSLHLGSSVVHFVK